MKRIALPDPPNPNTPQFRNAPLSWERATYNWMQQVKQIVQSAHNEVASPCGQQMLATSYSTNTLATGTMTGTDVANAICSLIATLTQKGILSPSITRGQSQ